MKRLFCSIAAVMTLVATSVMAEKASPADTDSDGKVTKEEFFAAREKYAQQQGKTFDQAASEKAFSARDTDKDGVLTGAEAAAKK